MHFKLRGFLLGLGVTTIGTVVSMLLPNGGPVFALGVGIAVSSIVRRWGTGSEVPIMKALAEGLGPAAVLAAMGYWLGIGR